MPRTAEQVDPVLPVRPDFPSPRGLGAFSSRRRPMFRWRNVLHFGGAAVAWYLAVREWWKFARPVTTHSFLGYDLKIAWSAEIAVAHHQPPYSVAGYVYPPSSLVVLRPLADVSFHAVAIASLWAIPILLTGTAMLSAATVGRRWWGLAPALVLLLLPHTEPVGDVIVLENLSVLIAFVFALFLLLATKGHWLAAAMVLGLTLAVKPLLLPLLVLFILKRRWRAGAVAVGIPAALNLTALAIVPDLGKLSSVMSFLFDRTGSQYDAYNSALVAVTRVLALPVGVGLLARVATLLLVVGGVSLAWTRIDDDGIKLVTVSSILMIGFYLAGSLSQDHYMLLLIPLAFSATRWRAPMQWPTAWWGLAWCMGIWTFSDRTLGLQGEQGVSVQRCAGLVLILCSMVAALLVDRVWDRLGAHSAHSARRRAS